jgi:hypothetical protein
MVAVQLLVLGVFLWAGNYNNMTTVESIRLLKKPLFNIGVIILGLIFPLGACRRTMNKKIVIAFPRGILPQNRVIFPTGSR